MADADPAARAVGAGNGTAPLPANWKAVRAPETGRIYYYNKITRETRWEPPTSPTTDGAAPGQNGTLGRSPRWSTALTAPSPPTTPATPAPPPAPVLRPLTIDMMAAPTLPTPAGVSPFPSFSALSSPAPVTPPPATAAVPVTPASIPLPPTPAGSRIVTSPASAAPSRAPPTVPESNESDPIPLPRAAPPEEPLRPPVPSRVAELARVFDPRVKPAHVLARASADGGRPAGSGQVAAIANALRKQAGEVSPHEGPRRGSGTVAGVLARIATNPIASPAAVGRDMSSSDAPVASRARDPPAADTDTAAASATPVSPARWRSQGKLADSELGTFISQLDTVLKSSHDSQLNPSSTRRSIDALRKSGSADLLATSTSSTATSPPAAPEPVSPRSPLAAVAAPVLCASPLPLLNDDEDDMAVKPRSASFGSIKVLAARPDSPPARMGSRPLALAVPDESGSASATSPSTTLAGMFRRSRSPSLNSSAAPRKEDLIPHAPVPTIDRDKTTSASRDLNNESVQSSLMSKIAGLGGGSGSPQSERANKKKDKAEKAASEKADKTRSTSGRPASSPSGTDLAASSPSDLQASPSTASSTGSKVMRFFKRGGSKTGKDAMLASPGPASPAAAPVFGGYLVQIAVHGVPALVAACTTFVERKGTQVEGIYRISGNAAAIQRLRAALIAAGGHVAPLGSGPPIPVPSPSSAASTSPPPTPAASPDCPPDVAAYDVHVVSGILKMFFRDLADPLLCGDLYAEWMQAGKVPGPSIARAQAVREVLRKLPPAHAPTLAHLIRHLHRLATHAERTKMDAANLAIVFGPNLLKPPKGVEESLDAIWNAEPQNAVVQDMIANADAWFPDEAEEGDEEGGAVEEDELLDVPSAFKLTGIDALGVPAPAVVLPAGEDARRRSAMPGM
ncbi:hypothetical protein AMAG_04566 [Allomyces macrogynus ATCC 38327]|uniref:Rho-GAP domain-containing protein n=1 Tax=Allomyces macrogynus (strain ATCC 38327) TaxID=578462 RepID=A0A0L0S590_ALLM3|nr:hypothetical protein AMAG_04566 [Allomyces macrogynus ATCC 38327]|eukprot:KNE57708.1 hypothetical protein AMAG_04566 [Allomyces macrogynus ATCC 38327]